MGSVLAEFIPAGPRTSLYTPTPSTGGQLIILCTWLGAAPKHIAKYIALYQQIAPEARILLIESAVPILISSYERQRKAIRPAVSVIMATLAECGQYPVPSDHAAANGRVHGDDEGRSVFAGSTAATNSPPRILLHIFSNGGTNTAAQLLIVLRECMRSPLPVAGLLFDSCPAKVGYWKFHNAMLLSLPNNQAWRLLGTIIAHSILIVLYIWIAWGNEHPAREQWRTLLDENVIVGASESGSAKAGDGKVVCYLYSKTDQICDWRDVRDHAVEARRKGCRVEEVVFEGSGHCAHLLTHRETYAQAVTDVWQRSDGGWKKGDVGSGVMATYCQMQVMVWPLTLRGGLQAADGAFGGSEAAEYLCTFL